MSRISPSPPGQHVLRRPTLPNGRAVAGGVLVAIAALLVLVGSRAATSAGPRTSVVLAARALAPGDVVTEADLSVIDVGDELEMASFRTPTDVVGTMVRVPIGRGEAIGPSALADRSATGRFELWLAIDSAMAGRELTPGDRIEVFATRRDETELVAVDASVLSVSLAGSSLQLRIGLRSFEELVAVVHADAAEAVTIARSTNVTVDLPSPGATHRPAGSAFDG